MVSSDKDPLLAGTVINIEDSKAPSSTTREEDVEEGCVLVSSGDKGGIASVHLTMELRALLVVSSIAQDAAATALSLYMIDDLSFEPIQLTQYWMYMGWSYTFSPAIGMVADVMVIGGEKRRPLIAFGALGSMAIFVLFITVPATTQIFSLFVVISFIHNICGACVASATNGAIVAMFSRTIESLYPDLATTASTRTGSVQGDTTLPNSDDEDRPHLDQEAVLPKLTRQKREQEKEALRVGLMAKVQSEAMLFRSAGSLISSILFTVMVIWCSLYTMLGVSAILFATILPTLSFLRSREHGLLGDSSGQCCTTLAATVSDITSRLRSNTHFSLKKLDRGVFGLLLVLVFVLVYTGVPDAGSVYFAYVGTQFMFPSWLLSLNMCLGTLGGTLSCFLFMHFQGKQQKREREQQAHPTRKVRAVTPFAIFAFGSICAAVGYVTNFMVASGFVVDTLHIPANVFIPFDNFMTSFFSRLAFLPILAVAAERCPAGYEAAFFEVFSALSIAGGTLSALITTNIAEKLNITSDDYSNTWILLLVCAGGKLLPIFAAAVLPIQKGGAKIKPLFGAQPNKSDSGSGAIVE